MKSRTTLRVSSHIVVFATALLAASCASIPYCDDYKDPVVFDVSTEPRISESAIARYQHVSAALQTDDDQMFHELVLDPSMLEGFGSTPVVILGLEKPTAGYISRWKDDRPRPYCFNEDCDGSRQFPILFGGKPGLAKLEKNFKDPNKFIPTHVVLYQQHKEACFVFNAYHNDKTCATSPSQEYGGTAEIITAGIASIEATKQALDNLIVTSRPSHVLVFSTGWNTGQVESLNNYALWLKETSKAAGQAFRPILIGITWQSTWDNIPLGKLISAFNKGNDADEIGAGWVHRFVHQSILPAAAEHRLSVIMVGHSYGVRVLGHSAFLPDLHGAKVQASKPALIGFAPALPIKRLIDSGREPYWAGSIAAPIMMTTSKYDTAAGLSKFVGSPRGLKEAGRNKALKKRVEVAVGDKFGMSPRYWHPEKVVLVDYSASAICTKPGTRGGAHSDVFDENAGRLIWGAIRANDDALAAREG